MSDTTVQTTVDLHTETPSMWTVVFLNDDFTPMQFVVHLLIAIFHQSTEDAVRIMLAVHHEGRAAVGSYTREIASNKAEQVMLMASSAQHPLQVYSERL